MRKCLAGETLAQSQRNTQIRTAPASPLLVQGKEKEVQRDADARKIDHSRPVVYLFGWPACTVTSTTTIACVLLPLFLDSENVEPVCSSKTTVNAVVRHRPVPMNGQSSHSVYSSPTNGLLIRSRARSANLSIQLALADKGANNQQALIDWSIGRAADLTKGLDCFNAAWRRASSNISATLHLESVKYFLRLPNLLRFRLKTLPEKIRAPKVEAQPR